MLGSSGVWVCLFGSTFGLGSLWLWALLLVVCDVICLLV